MTEETTMLESPAKRTLFSLTAQQAENSKTYISFSKGYLSFSDFDRCSDGSLLFKETYIHDEVEMILAVRIKDRFNGLFEEKFPKNIKIKRGKNGVRIRIRFPIKNFPYTLIHEGAHVDIGFRCFGSLENLKVDRSRYLKEFEKKHKGKPSKIKSNSSESSKPVNASVAWAATHPFQGGSCTPR